MCWLVPDLAGWRRERMPRLPQTAWFDMSPDWVCEILSPATARSDRVEKLPIYAAFGVGHVWLIDPELRTQEAFENREGGWFMLGGFEGEDRVSVAPFEAVGI
jgi:Uma2 family endonuclease